MKKSTISLVLTILITQSSANNNCLMSFEEFISNIRSTNTTILTQQEMVDLYTMNQKSPLCQATDEQKRKPIVVEKQEGVNLVDIENITPLIIETVVEDTTPIVKQEIKTIQKNRPLFRVKQKKDFNHISKKRLKEMTFEASKKGDFEKVLAIWKHISEKYNDSMAMKHVALIYEEGFGDLQPNYDLAKKWRKRAMETKYSNSGDRYSDSQLPSKKEV